MGILPPEHNGSTYHPHPALSLKGEGFGVSSVRPEQFSPESFDYEAFDRLTA